MRLLLHFLRSIIDDFWGTLRTLASYINEEERRLVIQSVVIGVVVWAFVIALKEGVHWLFHTTIHWLEEGPSLLLVFVPLLIGAAIVAAISRYHAQTIHYRDSEGHVHQLNDVEGDGLERAISLYYTSEPTLENALTGQEGVEVRWQLPTFSLALRKFVATLFTLGTGGSGGLEASVALIGESLSASLFKPRKLGEEAAAHVTVLERLWHWWQPGNPDHLQTAQLSGIAAAVAVLLGAPFAAAFFATEVMYRRRPIVEKLMFSLISALVAFFLTDVFSAGHTAIFEVEVHYVPPSDLPYFAVLALMSAVISLLGIFFRLLRGRFDHAFHHRLPGVYTRHLVGAALTAVVAISVAWFTQKTGLAQNGLELVLGPGESAIDAALAGQLTIAVALIALGAKMIATLTTITSGGSAGLLVPSLFFGTMVASAFANWFNYEPMMLIVPAMTASLVSLVNVPLAAILFTVEVFGSVYMVPALVVLVVTELLAHDNSIYRTQRETYDSRQILPGVSIRRVRMPASWAGQTLIDLDFRKRFDLNVIGLVEREGRDGRPRIRLGTASTTKLETGDVLVVLGRDEQLAVLETAVAELYVLERSAAD
ncbi:MAG: chloride channel protein [Anaerolineales bacterium]|nr:chloride channel protein [Anaerolineales bacterium]